MNDIVITNNPDKPKTLQLQEQIEDHFIELLFKYRSPRQAALEAGYSEAYAKNIRQQKLSNPKFLNKIKQKYNGKATLILPDIFHSEAKSINLSNDIVSQITTKINETDDLDTKVELANKALNILAKASPTRKELKQTAGVLATEGQTTVNMVNIESIQALIANNHDDMLNPKPDTD